jgi:large subunit ribosomal protein L21
MEYGIIEASGRQYWIEQGKFIEVNNLSIKSGSKILIRRVLFGRNKDEIFIGKPYLTQVKVEATVGKHFLGPKVIIYKMKPKKKYRRKNGHRQQLTRLLIEKITF